MLSPARLPFLVLAGLMVSALVARADDDGVTNGLAAARSWLAEIDAGQYDQSYLEAGSALHDKVPQENWVKILNTERPLLGKVVSRQEVSHTLHPDGLEGVSGTFLVVSYHTDFSAKQDEVEYVVVRHEFGGWRCVGYDFGPANPPPPSDSDSRPTTTTTDETLAPPTPTNGMVVPASRNANH